MVALGLLLPSDAQNELPLFHMTDLTVQLTTNRSPPKPYSLLQYNHGFHHPGHPSQKAFGHLELFVLVSLNVQLINFSSYIKSGDHFEFFSGPVASFSSQCPVIPRGMLFKF